jgi:hypothetical protein
MASQARWTTTPNAPGPGSRSPPDSRRRTPAAGGSAGLRCGRLPLWPPDAPPPATPAPATPARVALVACRSRCLLVPLWPPAGPECLPLAMLAGPAPAACRSGRLPLPPPPAPPPEAPAACRSHHLPRPPPAGPAACRSGRLSHPLPVAPPACRSRRPSLRRPTAPPGPRGPDPRRPTPCLPGRPQPLQRAPRRSPTSAASHTASLANPKTGRFVALFTHTGG